MLRRTTKKTLPSLYRIAFCPLNTVRFYSSSSDYSSGSASNESSQTQSYGSSSGEDVSEQQQGRPQRKQRDYSSTLYVKLPVGASREKLTEVLNQAGITGVVNVQIPRDVLTDTPKAFAFIEFESADAASKAINTPVSLDGQSLKLSNSRSKEESRRYRVYIGDLAYTTKEQDLTSALETQFGPVEYARITSHNGASRGYGFATFKTIEAADAARAAGSFSLDDRVVRVESVRDMESRRPGGRFGDDRRGGFGDSRSGGYGERSERSYGGGGYGRRGQSGSSEGGYGGSRDGGYGGSRDGGYGGNRDGGYGGGRRGGYDSKESDSDSGYGSGGRRGGGYGGRGGSSDNLY